jgi:hypothetical protein
MTNFIQIAAQPPATSVTADGQQWIHALIEVVKILAVLAGSLAGGYFSHRLLLRRDVSGRKRAFRAFMYQLRSEIVDRYHDTVTFAGFYQNKIPNLQHEAATILDDLPKEKRVEFERLVAVASGFKGTAPDGSTKPIVEAIDAIIKFIET